MKQILVILSLLLGASFCNDGAYANIASKEYVAKLSDVKESLSNKTDMLDETSTTTQYPSAKSVYDNLTYRVDVRDSANQTLAGKIHGVWRIYCSRPTAANRSNNNGDRVVCVAYL